MDEIEKIETLPPETIKKVLALNERLIVKKMVEEKKPLSASEIAYLKNLLDKKGTEKKYVKKISSLAKAIGCHRTTIYSYKNDPDFPKPDKNLGYDVDEVKNFLIQKKAIPPELGTLEYNALQDKVKAEAEKEKQRAKLLALKVLKEQNKLVDADKVIESISSIISDLSLMLRDLPGKINKVIQDCPQDRREIAIREIIEDNLTFFLNIDVKKKIRDSITTQD